MLMSHRTGEGKQNVRAAVAAPMVHRQLLQVLKVMAIASPLWPVEGGDDFLDPHLRHLLYHVRQLNRLRTVIGKIA